MQANQKQKDLPRKSNGREQRRNDSKRPQKSEQTVVLNIQHEIDLDNSGKSRFESESGISEPEEQSCGTKPIKQ